LKEILPLCPTYLPARELVDRLLEFVAVNQARLNRAIFDPAYVDQNFDVGRATGVALTALIQGP